MLKILEKYDRFLIFSLVLFLALLIPFLGVIPHRDGNIEFVQAHDFYTGGFSGYLESRPMDVHPPLKLILTKVFFLVFGVNSFSYTLIGLISGVIGLAFLFFLTKNLFGRKTARMTSMLLATSPLFLSTAIFALRDYFVTILVIISLYFYLKKRHWFYTLTASLLVLTKETGILLPLSVILIECLCFIKKTLKKKTLAKGQSTFVFFAFPIIVFLFWILFLKIFDRQPWGDHILADTAEKGSVYTIIHNLFTFGFLNKYTYQHWRQLFFLNFNWAYWSITLAGLFAFLSKKSNRIAIFKNLNKKPAKTKTLTVIGLFSLSYFFTVLTFPTYTIPRYALPLIPFLLMATALVLNRLVVKYKTITPILITAIIILLSLFYSIDPLSIKLWGKTEIYGERFYGLNYALDGNDGITYNIQYLLIVKKRTKQIIAIENQKQPLLLNECDSVFPDPNNDYQTFGILNFKNLASNPLCVIK